MKRIRAKDDPQLSLDLASSLSRESKSVSGGHGGNVVALRKFAERKQNSAKSSALRKVLEHAESLSW